VPRVRDVVRQIVMPRDHRSVDILKACPIRVAHGQLKQHRLLHTVYLVLDLLVGDIILTGGSFGHRFLEPQRCLDMR